MKGFFNERWITALILATVALSASLSGALTRFDNLLYDIGQRAVSKAAPDDVVIVAIDQESLSQLGRWPWSRRIHAALVDRLHAEGARVIALDILFAEPDASDQIGDQELAQAIARAGNVVLPVVIEQGRLQGELVEAGALPLLAESAAATGRVHVEIEDDGIARGFYLREGLGDAYWPHFTEAIYGLAAQKPVVLGNAAARAGSHYKLIREGYQRIPFIGGAGHFLTLSYTQVLTGNYPAGMLKDKIVLVGATAVGLGDRLPTPVSGLAEGMPGVEVHANIFEAFRQQTLIGSLPAWMAMTLTLILSLATVPVLSNLNPRAGLFASVLLFLAVAALAITLPHLTSYWFPPSGALLAILIAYPVWSWRRLEAASRYIDRELDSLKQDMKWSVVGGVAAETEASGADDVFESRIADIQSASSQLRRLRKLVDQVLEGMPHGVVALDKNGRIRLMNQRASKWMQLEPDTPPTASSGLLAVEKQREIRSVEGLPLMMDQTDVVSAEDSESGISKVINLMDISEVKRLEAEKRETLAFLSHDLRAPLSLAMDMASQGNLSPAELTNLRHQVMRAYGMAEEFLSVARAETADESAFAELDIAGLSHQAADAVYDLARAKKVNLTRRISEYPVWIRGEFGLLERMAVNLIQNAIKYAPEGGLVSVELSVNASGKAMFCVQDNGPGIAAEDLPRLFRRFSRIEGEDQSKTKGAGLGLYFVRIVAEKHGGEVSAESPPGQGARFCVSLPTLD